MTTKTKIRPSSLVSDYPLDRFIDDADAAHLLIRACDYYGAWIAFVETEPTEKQKAMYGRAEPFRGFCWRYLDRKSSIHFGSGIVALYDVAVQHQFIIPRSLTDKQDRPARRTGT